MTLRAYDDGVEQWSRRARQPAAEPSVPMQNGVMSQYTVFLKHPRPAARHYSSSHFIRSPDVLRMPLPAPHRTYAGTGLSMTQSHILLLPLKASRRRSAGLRAAFGSPGAHSRRENGGCLSRSSCGAGRTPLSRLRLHLRQSDEHVTERERGCSIETGRMYHFIYGLPPPH